MWLRYQNGSDPMQTQFFRTLKFVPNEDTEVQEITTMRRRRVRKVFATWSTWEISIGMDQLYDPAKKAWLMEWWKADRAWLHASTDSGTEPLEADAGWVEIALPGGPVPFTYPTGSKNLPSFAANVTAAVGVV